MEQWGSNLLAKSLNTNMNIRYKYKNYRYREGDGTPLQYFHLENPRDGGAWWATVHGVTRSQTRLSDFTLIFHFHALEKETATQSSVLAWRIPGTGEHGALPSMGSHRVGHDWSDAAVAAEHIVRTWLTANLFHVVVCQHINQGADGLAMCVLTLYFC